MARLDVGWHANPKILRLSPVGMALHAWSISYCDSARSDGFIPEGAWPSKLRAGVKELDHARLYRSAVGGYWLHDYLDYNHSRAQIDDYVRAKQEAGRAGGQASASARARAPTPPNGQPERQPERQANGKQVLKQKSKQNPTPSPGPGVNSSVAAAAAPEGGVGETIYDWKARADALMRQAAAAAATQNLLNEETPHEVRQRLERAPLC